MPYLRKKHKLLIILFSFNTVMIESFQVEQTSIFDCVEHADKPVSSLFKFVYTIGSNHLVYPHCCLHVRGLDLQLSSCFYGRSLS